jgi:hypothetical protein
MEYVRWMLGRKINAERQIYKNWGNGYNCRVLPSLVNKAIIHLIVFQINNRYFLGVRICCEQMPQTLH